MITYLALAFLLLIIGIIFYGFGILIRRPPTSEEMENERCSICGRRIPKSNLIERQIGDHKLLYFCEQCIQKLQSDLKALLHGSSTSKTSP